MKRPFDSDDTFVSIAFLQQQIKRCKCMPIQLLLGVKSFFQ